MNYFSFPSLLQLRPRFFRGRPPVIAPAVGIAATLDTLMLNRLMPAVRSLPLAPRLILEPVVVALWAVLDILFWIPSLAWATAASLALVFVSRFTEVDLEPLQTRIDPASAFYPAAFSVVRDDFRGLLGLLRSRPRLREILAFGAPVFSLIVSCVVLSARKEPWSDEVMTLRILTLPTWSEMWSAVTDAIGHLPAYFIAARLWVDIFGATPLALRLFSSLSFAGAFVLVCLALRSVVGPRTIALAVGCIVAFSPTLIDQNAEVRFYGLFFLGVAAALYTFVRSEREASASTALVVADAGIHAVLVLTHVFGILFSMLILAARASRGVVMMRRRWRSYVGQIAGMAVFFLWLPVLPRQSSPMAPHYIHPVPTIYDLARVSGVELHELALSLMLILVLAALPAITRPAAHDSLAAPTVPVTRTPIFVVAVALSLAPAAIFLYSKIGTPVLVARYFLPTLIGWTIFLALLADHLVSKPIEAMASGTLRSGLSALLATVTAGLFLFPIALTAHQPQQHGYGAMDAKFADYGLPIVVENDVAYMARSWNGPKPELYYYVLDWETAMVPGNEKNAAVGFKLQTNAKSHFAALNIVPYDRFLVENPKFLVAHSPTNLWAERRLLDNPAYRVTRLGPITGSSFNETMVLVERVTTAKTDTPK